ncbi:hypothetical protein RFI_15605 [Reticulomyxa filosa]|uniref:Fatty acid desaturase domain-containing protein n=1 Tax=Reticulomyxa filosa TaxID=46433 RepID=X6N767_RETFI|nr:hypothetical protein RFI_15605 [Reticulomyxa filosa]|eukprot:ETO21599.1 hypothetical protein RFI_15605 [Reticulomyxa filosa]
MVVKHYYSNLVQMLVSEILWFGSVYVLWQVRPAFSLWLLVVPQFVVSFLLMFGNFSQHIFVDSKDYSNDHKLTINLINTPYNQLTFNDGYHIVHHKYPTLHWTELPTRFATSKELQLHANSDAICFENVDYFVMGVFVMTGYLNKLAEKMIPLNEKQANMTLQDKINFLKNRLKPIPSPQLETFDPLFGIFKYFFNP